MAQMTLDQLKNRSVSTAPVEASFFTSDGFALIQRVAGLFANSTMVPEAYRTTVVDKKTRQAVPNPAALSNCVVALNMAQRLGADPLMVMQNLYVVEGRPAWSSQFIISAINASGRFSPLRFDITDLGEKDMEYTVSEWTYVDGRRQKQESVQRERIHNAACVAWATETATGQRLESPKITVEMAVIEGWYGKNGSKWRTMPEVMLRYRAASFFGKLYAPELLMGLQTVEEAREVIDVEVADAEPAAEKPRPSTSTEEIERKARRGKKLKAMATETQEAPVEEPELDAATLPAEEELPTTAEVEPQRKSTRRIPCPDLNGKLMLQSECDKCTKREGCPSLMDAQDDEAFFAG